MWCRLNDGSLLNLSTVSFIEVGEENERGIRKGWLIFLNKAGEIMKTQRYPSFEDAKDAQALISSALAEGVRLLDLTEPR